MNKYIKAIRSIHKIFSQAYSEIKFGRHLNNAAEFIPETIYMACSKLKDDSQINPEDYIPKELKFYFEYQNVFFAIRKEKYKRRFDIVFDTIHVLEPTMRIPETFLEQVERLEVFKYNKRAMKDELKIFLDYHFRQ